MSPLTTTGLAAALGLALLGPAPAAFAQDQGPSGDRMPTVRTLPGRYSRDDAATAVYNNVATGYGMQVLSQSVDLGSLMHWDPCPPGSLCHEEQDVPLAGRDDFDGQWAREPGR